MKKPFFLLFIALSVCTCQIEKTNPYVNSHDRFSPEIRFDTLELSDSQFFDLFSKMALIPETKGNLTSLGTLADFNAWLKGHYPDLFIFTITAQWDGPSKMWLGIFKNTAKLYANDNDVECLFGMADYDDAQATYLQAVANVEAAGAAVQTADINLAYTKVYAPISGRISRSNVTEGALVSAQQAEPMTTIQQLDPMYVDLGQTVEAHLQLREAIASGQFKITEGKAPVDIYFSNGDKYPIQGQLEFSEVSVDETTGMVNLRAIVPNPDGVILPGMFLRGDLTEGVLPDAVILQQDAVIREAIGTTYVYVVDGENKAARKDITVGPNYDRYFVILDGLKPGDKVITSNIQKLRTGTLVEVVDLDDSAPAEGQSAEATTK